MKNFFDISNLNAKDLYEIIDLNVSKKTLNNKNIGLIFENTQLELAYPFP